MIISDYTPSYNAPGKNLFCVMKPGHLGPIPSFWPNMKSCVQLLARYVNNDCGQGVTVWRRASARSTKWVLVSGG